MIRCAAALVLAAAACTPTAQTPAPPAPRHAASAFIVTGTTPRCGATAIGRHLLLTAAHCAWAPATLYVDRPSWRWGWKTHLATAGATDKVHDLALLHTVDPLPAMVSVALWPPNDGDPVCWSHHGGRLPYQWACGRIVDTAAWTMVDGHRVDVIATDLAALPGSSGAALLTPEGRIVGVCIARVNTDRRALFAPWTAVLDLQHGDDHRTSRNRRH